MLPFIAISIGTLVGDLEMLRALAGAYVCLYVCVKTEGRHVGVEVAM